MITRDFSEETSKWIIAIVNFFLISVVSWRTISIDSGEADLFFGVFYGAILMFNLAAWVFLALLKNRLVREVRRVLFSLLIVFILILSFAV